MGGSRYVFQFSTTQVSAKTPSPVLTPRPLNVRELDEFERKLCDLPRCGCALPEQPPKPVVAPVPDPTTPPAPSKPRWPIIAWLLGWRNRV